MLKLEVSKPSAGDLRQELLILLGLATPAVCESPKDETTESTEAESAESTEAESADEAAVEKKRKRRTKAQIEADAAKETPVVQEPVVVEEPEPVVVEEPVKVVEVVPPTAPENPDKITPHILRAACIKASDRVGGDPVFAVLAEYGAKSAAEVKDADLKAAYDKITKMGL